MHITQRLLETSYQDFELIQNLESQGANPNLIHTLDYCFIAPDKDKAELVCSFIRDNAYGNARVESNDESHRIIVEIQAPLIRHLIYNVSANMVSISYMFSIEFVGWGTCVETE